MARNGHTTAADAPGGAKPSPATGLDARGGLSLFRVAGIQVRVDPSWLLIFGLILWSLSAGYFPRTYPDSDTASYWTAGLLSTLLFFASLLVHELSHSIMARRAGLEVPSITLFLFGGASEMTSEPDDPATEFRIAIVGPLASFVLAVLFWIAGSLVPAGLPPLFGAVLEYLAWINLALGVFNLLPGLPLDGGRVVRAIVWWRTGSIETGSRVASRAGQGLGLGLMVLGGLQIFGGALVGGIWLILIGLFVRGLAASSHRGLRVRQALEGLHVADVMVSEVETVPPGLSVQALIDDHILARGYRGFPVVDETGRVLGLVSLESVREVPPERRADTRVEERLEPASADRWIEAGAPLTDALAVMSRTGFQRLLVGAPADGLVGLLTSTGLARAMELRTALAGDAD